MKLTMFAAVAVLISATASAAPLGSGLPEKEDIVTLSMSAFGRQGGEDIGTAVVIPAVPFSDAGTTAGYANDYDEVCPYTGSASPDVVYSYWAPEDMCISIDLCNSFYDTKVYVYENDSSTLIACNDDNFDCVDPPVSYTSWIPEAVLTGGNTYYIVVDGYAGDAGDYVMDVTEVDCPVPCLVECPLEGIDEGEGPCYDGYVDAYNGGCDSEPEAYVYVTPSTETITYCGQGGNYDAGGFRDTDWYWMDLTDATNEITICVEAEFLVTLGFVDMSPGCEGISSLYSYVQPGPCEQACLTEVLPPGSWCVFVASDWQDWPCDSDYVLTIDGYESTEPIMGALDIKPTSCPNPLNVKSQGVLPAAILGTADFDAAYVDVSSILLEGVPPLRSNLSDVATPVGDDAEPCECNEEGGDGVSDLTLKFRTQDIVDVLGAVSDGDEVELTLTGQLMDGTPFTVSDCVWILDRGREPSRATPGDDTVEITAPKEGVEDTTWTTIKGLYR